MVLVEEGQATLTATVVRVGSQAWVIPAGKPFPPRGIVIGPATREVVYQTFYEATHCPRGHVRDGDSGRCRFGSECYRGKVGDRFEEWTWGEPG